MTKQTIETLHRDLHDLLVERKAMDVSIIAMEDRSLADYLIIASGNVSRHVQSLADESHKLIKKNYRLPVDIEGYHQGDWVLLDAKYVIVHIFRPEVRAYYDLEGMWKPLSAEPQIASS